MALQLAPADFKSVAVQFEAKASCDIEGVEDDKEIQACVAAIQSSAKRLSLPDLRHVRSLHAEVMSKRPEIAGRLRDCMVWIGGISIETARFIPPPHDAVSSCLTEHFHYLDLATHELSQVQDVVTRLAISHAHFEAVHPFRDGNGRVGRVLAGKLLRIWSGKWVPLSVGLQRKHRAYYDVLAAAQKRREYEPLVKVLRQLSRSGQRSSQQMKGGRSRLSCVRSSTASLALYGVGATSFEVSCR
jgi:Fic family protein